MLVSIVVINHNYGRFLGAAIDSSLAQSWPDCEIIVVDDGSTDRSRDVIAGFAGRVVPVLKENGGHISAVNAGFAASRGGIVLFLDADDELYPHCVATLMESWSDRATKLQFRLDTIDRSGENMHLIFPHYTDELLTDHNAPLDLVLTMGAYPWPGSSGNAFSRAFLLQTLPLPAQLRRAPDGMLNRLAPLYGPVISINDVLAAYRVHGDNVLAQATVSPHKLASVIRYEMAREDFYRSKAAERGYIVDRGVLLRNKSHLEARLLSLRLCGADHPIREDTAFRLTALGIKSVFIAPELTVMGRFLWVAWFCYLGFFPAVALTFAVRYARLALSRNILAEGLIKLSRRPASLTARIDDRPLQARADLGNRRDLSTKAKANAATARVAATGITEAPADVESSPVTGGCPSQTPNISIIISNYNYEQYIGLAIRSALDQTVACEVIVIDDGSTDGSRSVIESFGDSIKILFQANGGQASAFNNAFPKTTGDLVIFLDADDLLYPTCAETVLRSYRADLSKIQYRLDTIGPEGVNTNLPFPHYSPDLDPARILELSLTCGSYPWPVTSGNAYCRTYLETVLPIQDPRFRNTPDGVLNKLAPLYGDVLSIPIVLGAYRVHDANYWARNDKTELYSRYIRHEVERQEVFEARVRDLGLTMPSDPLFANKNHLETRILSLRLTPDRHPCSADTLPMLLRKAVRAVLKSRDTTAMGRVIWLVYFLGISVIPKPWIGPILEKLRGASVRTRVARRLVSISRC